VAHNYTNLGTLFHDYPKLLSREGLAVFSGLSLVLDASGQEWVTLDPYLEFIAAKTAALRVQDSLGFFCVGAVHINCLYVQVPSCFEVLDLDTNFVIKLNLDHAKAVSMFTGVWVNYETNSEGWYKLSEAKDGTILYEGGGTDSKFPEELTPYLVEGTNKLCDIVKLPESLRNVFVLDHTKF